MAGSVNKVILIGNLGKDPEVRNAQDGTKIVSFSVATSESWKDKQSGERKDRTEWHRVVLFNDRLGEVAEKYLKKGYKVYVEGKLKKRSWQDKDGNTRYSTEIIADELTILSRPEGSEKSSEIKPPYSESGTPELPSKLDGFSTAGEGILPF